MKTKHDGDCPIYACLDNGRPENGICVCGYGWDYLTRNAGDYSELYSDELKRKIFEERKNHPEREEDSELLLKIFGGEI